MGVQAPTYVFSGVSVLNLAIAQTKVDAIGNEGPFSYNTSVDMRLVWADGSGNGQGQRIYVARVLLTPSSGTFDLDLSTMTDPFGNIINPSKIKELSVFNRSDVGGGNLLVGAASSNPWVGPWASSGAPTTVKETVQPEGIWYQRAPNTGLTVSATSKVLRFTHGGGSSGSIPFDIYLLCVQ